jgi:hypothetical protein
MRDWRKEDIFLSKILASLYSFAKEGKASRIVNNYIVKVLIYFPKSREAKVLRDPTGRTIHEASIVCIPLPSILVVLRR